MRRGSPDLPERAVHTPLLLPRLHALSTCNFAGFGHMPHQEERDGQRLGRTQQGGGGFPDLQ